MEEENGFDGDERTNKAAPSRREEEGEEKSSNMNGEQQQENQKSKRNEKTKTVPFFKLFSFADFTDIVLMIAGTVGAIGNGLSLPLMTILLGEAINSFGQSRNEKDVVDLVSKVALKYVYLGIGGGIGSFLEVTCWMVTGERQAMRIRSVYLKTILRQDIAFFDKETSTGEIIGRMSGDTVLIQDAMGEKVGKCLQLVATFVGGFTIAMAKGWLLTLVLLSVIPLLVLSGVIVAKMMTSMATRGQKAYADAATVAEQTIGSIRTVVSFTGEKRATNAYNRLLVKAYKSSILEGIAIGLGAGVVMLVVISSYAMAVWFGGKLILHKGYTGGQVINVIVAVLTASMSLGQASSCFSAFATGRAAAYKMFETINRIPEIDAYDTSGRILDDICGDIELKDVYFSYPARPDEQVFSGFSLLIPSGTTTALVGHSGSGKSTVIGLIERFYDPQAGEILLDGVNLKELQLKWIRQKIGLVSQEPVLFASSIKDNIAYGKKDATIDEIKAAAELANAARFIEKLPQGYDTMTGERGTSLSGGQKQRIAIARAILKDPRILLLDEATSALDAESERIVQEALERSMVNRTTVVVAHRLTTVRNADLIAVIHQGKIVEKGSHTGLLEDPAGAYSQLIHLQEMNTKPEHTVYESTKSEITSESFRRSSQRFSFQRSMSKGSSRESSRRSFNLALGLPTGLDAPDIDRDDPEGFSPKEKVSEVPLHRIAYLNKPEIPVLILGTIAASVNGTILPLYGTLISKAIKTFFEPPHKLRKDSEFWALMFLTLGFGSLLIYPVRTYLFSVAGSKLIQRIRSTCFEKVIHMEIGWFDEPEHSTGSIIARLSADAARVRALVGDSLAEIVQSIATAVAGIVIAFLASWQLALIILAIVPLLGINGFLQAKFSKGFSADAKTMYEEASQIANDAVSSIRTVASFCAEENVMLLYEKKCESPAKAGVRLGLISGIGFGVSSFFFFCFYAIGFYSGSRLIEHGYITFADVFQVFLALAMATTSISNRTSLAADSTKAKAAAASVFAILDRNSEIDASDESGLKLDNVNGEIELEHVSFRYPSRPDIQILKDINLTIRSGKTVALVGESGSGKSTVVALLQRFYDPDSGRITLDGTELRSFQLKWLRQQMGLVSQEPVLFNDTIRANIAYGKEGEASEAEITAAAELANAHKFISSLSQGYDTVVGERGIQLSGGQKQRVAIARAIVKGPKILLLDEATSALDAESERVVQDALDRVMVNRTTIVVAHRLSTIRNADLIAVLKNGVIVEKGRHENLINIKDGLYASLVALHTAAKTV